MSGHTPTKHDPALDILKSIASDNPPCKKAAGIRPLHSIEYIHDVEKQQIRNGNYSDLMLVRGLDSTTYSKKVLMKVLDLYKAWDKFLKLGSFAEWAQKHKKDLTEAMTNEQFLEAGVETLRLLVEAAPDFGGLARAGSKTNRWYQELWDMKADDLLSFLENPENAKVLRKFQELARFKAGKPFLVRVQHQLPIALKIADVDEEDAIVVLNKLMALTVAPDSAICQKWGRLVAAKMLQNRKEKLPALVKFTREVDQKGRAFKRPSNSLLVGTIDDDDHDEPMEDPVDDAPTLVRTNNTAKRARFE